MSGSISATTLAYVGAAAAVAGAATTAYGAVSSAEAQSDAAKYNEKLAANNAQIATQNAKLAGAAGEAQAEQASLQTRAKVGGILANQAAGNVDVTSGSALDVRSSAKEFGELNALTMRSNAARQAYGNETGSASEVAQSQLDASTAANASAAGGIGAGAGVLSGLGGAANNYAKYTMNNSNGTTLNSGNPSGAYTDSSGINWAGNGQSVLTPGTAYGDQVS